MNKEAKNKVLTTFVISTFLLLFAFQGNAKDSTKTEPASIEDVTIKPAPPTQESFDDVTEDDDDSSAVYYPSTEDFNEDDDSIDE